MWSHYRKLSVSVAALALLGLAVGAFSVYVLQTVIQSKDLIIYGHAQDLVDLEALQVTLERKVSASRGFFLAGDPALWEKAQASRGDFLVGLERLRRTGDPRLRELLGRVAAAEREHEESLERAADRRRAGADPREIASLWEEEVKPRRDRLDRALVGAVHEQRALLEGARRRSAEAASRATKLAVATAALLVPLLGGICVLAFRLLARLSRAEADLARRLREQSAVVEFGRHALTDGDVALLAREATTILAHSLGAPLAGYFESAPGGEGFLLKAGVGWRQGVVGEARLPAGALGDVASTRRGRFLASPGDGDGRVPPPLSEEGVQAGILMPAVSGRGTLGILGVFDREERAFGPHDLNLVHALANVLAGAIERRRSDDRIRAAVESAPHAVLLVDRQGAISFVNSQAEALFGYARSELLGRPVEDLIPERFRGGHGEYRRDFFSSPSARPMGAGRDLFCRRKDGTEVPVEVGLNPLRTEEGEFVIASVVDITGRRQAEEARRRLAAIVDSTGEAIVSTDLHGTVQTWNAAAERLFGYSASEMVGKPVADLTPDEPEARRQFRENLRQVLAGETVQHRETIRVAKDGRRIPIALTLSPIRGAGGQVAGISGIARDVSQEREAREERRRSEEHFRVLVETAEDYGIIFLDPEGTVASWNPGAERLLGYRSSEILGQHVARFFAPEHVAEGLPERELQTATRRGKATDDNWLVRKDGRRFWASGTTTSLRAPDGALRGFIKIFRDLTERKRFEDEIQRLNTALESRVAERTMQLEAFTYTVSHDLRAPLRAMNGFSHALLHDYAHCLDEQGRGYARRILEASARMDALIQDLLEYSRLAGTDFVPEPVELDAVVADVASDMQPQVEEVRAELAVEGPLGSVRGHAVTLKQVVYNLLSNALKFVPAGVQPRVRVRSEQREGWVRLWVEDNGIGIDPTHAGRIFGVFERLHPDAYPGTGIGLAIVKKGVERLGGRVGVESGLGRGSRFFVELPGAKAGRRAA